MPFDVDPLYGILDEPLVFMYSTGPMPIISVLNQAPFLEIDDNEKRF